MSAARTTYDLPECLQGCVERAVYRRWLQRKAAAHARRDRRRGNGAATVAAYKRAIHEAIVATGGCDAYTGARLDWTLISQYDNAISKARRRAYKKEFADLPTVDHVGDGLDADFRIASWRTNDAKHDLTGEEFLALCQAVLEHHGYTVTRAPSR